MMRLSPHRFILSCMVFCGTMATSSVAFADMAPVGPLDDCGCSGIYLSAGDSYLPAMTAAAVFVLIFVLWNALSRHQRRSERG